MSNDRADFVTWFRRTAPYVHAHRGKTVVILFGGEVFRSKGMADLIHDIALLHALGLRLVLVAGARPQIDARLKQRGEETDFVAGVRVTSDAALECVKEAAGTTRVELESLLSMGLPNSPMEGARIRVATGNFVTARPIGVVEGVDFQHTGAVRRIDVAAIQQRLDDEAIVVLTPIAYSITGDTFNISSRELAQKTAVALGADKLVCLMEGKGVADAEGQRINELSIDEAKALAKRRGARELKLHLRAAIEAAEGNVPRTHLIPRRLHGGLLQELFTRDGVGTLVSQARFEGIRPARVGDIGGLLQLLEPLERKGILVRRPRELLEADIQRFTVIERDGFVVACMALYEFRDERKAEIACVAVHPDFRDKGRGDALLTYHERRCKERGIDTLFLLTTQTAHWFRERGFVEGKRRDLPKGKRVNVQRRSKVMLKKVE